MATRSSQAARLVPVWAIVAALLGFSTQAIADDTVSLLDAQRSGELNVVARGHGQSQVKFSITNKSARRLNVVVPPGLVAASAVSQGFQSMGLGGLSNQPGRFGQFATTNAGTGFRSLPTADSTSGLAISEGQTVELLIPSVCLNFGIATPTAKDVFVLKDVTEYTSDPRAVKALRSLASLGTSQGVAQAVAWNVFNGMSFERIAKEGREYVNIGEVSLAARFVDALDMSGTQEIVDPAYFREGRILVRTQGESSMGKVAARVGGELQGQCLMGLPVQVVDELSAEHARPASLLVDTVIIGGDRENQTRIRANLRYHTATGGWTKLNPIDLTVPSAPGELSGPALATALDRAIASALVTTTPARRGNGTTTFKVSNRLPFTIETVVLNTSRGENPPRVSLDGIGIGPGRSAMANIPAAIGLVERVELNGL